MESNVFPDIGRLPIRDVTATHLLPILKPMDKRSAQTLAQMVRQWCSSVFPYAVITQRADADPAAALRGFIERPPVQQPCPMSEAEISDFWARLRRFGGNRQTAIAEEMLLYLFVHTGELRLAEWGELELDRAERVIPAERMKKRRIHVVPLPHQAVTLFRELKGITGAGRWLFPSLRRPIDGLNATAVNRALEYMGYATATVIGHDFRATASTRLHELGSWPDITEMQLAHEEQSKTKEAYNHAQHLPERRQMMQG